jgi:serine/threonine protein kinase
MPQRSLIIQKVMREYWLLMSEDPLVEAVQYQDLAVGCANGNDAPNHYRSPAEEGLAESQSDYGINVENVKKIISYYEEQANWNAVCNLGVCLEGDGDGLYGAESVVEAARLYRKAAWHDLAEALFNYGRCLEFGKGVERNIAEASGYYRAAVRKMEKDKRDNPKDDPKSSAEKEISESCLRCFEKLVLGEPWHVKGEDMQEELQGDRRGIRGGNSVVYPIKAKTLAVKVVWLKKETDSERRVIRELAVMLMLSNHPCVVPIRSWFTMKGDELAVCIVMDFMKNRSLLDLNESIAQTDSVKKSIIMVGVIWGMRYVHSLGIVHRDVKPGNILLDEKFRPCIADFGISRMAESKISTQVSGTRAYLPPNFGFISSAQDPEADNCENPGPEVDVYGFGMTFFDFLGGKRDKDRNTWLTEDQLKGLEQHKVTNDMIELIKSCVSRTPGNRPNFAEICTKVVVEMKHIFFTDIDDEGATTIGEYIQEIERDEKKLLVIRSE